MDYYEKSYTLPTEFNNFHLGYQYNEKMQPIGSGLGFTTSTIHEGGNYKLIGYNFDALTLRHHTSGQNKDEVIKAKDASLDLDVRINFKPSDKGNTFTAILKPHNLTMDQAGKIEGFLNKKR